MQKNQISNLSKYQTHTLEPVLSSHLAVFSPGFCILGSKGPKKLGHLRDRLGRYGIRMYMDGRQLNDVIFDHSLIVTEINFTKTLNEYKTIYAVKFCCVSVQAPKIKKI